TIGNHEFDDGVEGVVPFLENVEAPFLSYPELSSTGKLKFLDEIEEVTKEAANLKTQGADIIIALSHCGLDVDRELAAAVEDLDVIVGGHSHSFLYTGTPPSVEVPVDDYPVVVTQSGGRQVLIVQAFAFSKYVGNITVWFDDRGESVYWEGSPILLDNSVTQEMKPWQESISEQAKAVIGNTKVYLDASNSSCRKGECNIGRFITDAYVEEYVKTAPEGFWTRASIGIINSGGIRASIEETRPGGDITYEDLKLSSPFSNTVDYIELQGKHLLEALEFSVVNWSSIKVKFDLRNEVNNRAVEVSVRCAECRVPKFEPLDPEKWYGIAINSYLVEGGDGYSVIADNLQNHFIGRVDTDVFKDYISKMSPITTGIDGNVEIIDIDE
ncbi:hypothetical protein L9F63_004779, partial [Diploptera punctata]